MNAGNVSRRMMLKGGAVALSLPWLETLASRTAQAAGAAPIRRYIAMYFPNGTTDKFWLPSTPGPLPAGAASAILEPLAPSNKYMLVLDGVGNYSAYGYAHAEPSHGTSCGSAWHCTDPRKGTAANVGGGISVDQVIAAQIGGATPIPSLQIGLSTLDSFCDGPPCAHSRSMSWSGPNMPLYKVVNPQAVFDRLVTAGAPMAGQTTMPTGNTNMPNPALAQTRALQKSVLDSVLDSATTLRTKVSMGDQARIDQYLTSVRDLEKLVAAPAMQVGGGGPTVGCTGMPRPPEAYADMNTPPDYSRETHSNLMIQLVTMAFACDITRTVTFMLDDARSDFVYSHLPLRNFNKPATGMLSTPYPNSGTLAAPGTATAAGYHGLQHAGPPLGNFDDGFASIGWWMAYKANQMAQALLGISQGTGTVLDSTVIHLGSGMHGSNHDGLHLPIVLIGSGGGVLKQGQFINSWANADAPGGGVRLANLHLTLIQKVFGSPATSFGVTGAMPASTTFIPDLLA